MKYFDLCSGALIPDIMHDVLEGVLQYEVLKHVESHYVQLSKINQIIESSELGYMVAPLQLN